jgi:hypothetical protein
MKVEQLRAVGAEMTCKRFVAASEYELQRTLPRQSEVRHSIPDTVDPVTLETRLMSSIRDRLASGAHAWSTPSAANVRSFSASLRMACSRLCSGVSVGAARSAGPVDAPRAEAVGGDGVARSRSRFERRLFSTCSSVSSPRGSAPDVGPGAVACAGVSVDSPGRKRGDNITTKAAPIQTPTAPATTATRPDRDPVWWPLSPSVRALIQLV